MSSTNTTTTTTTTNATIGLRPDRATTLEINSWTPEPSELGAIVFNTDTNKINQYNGTSFVEVLSEDTTSITVLNPTTEISGQTWGVKSTVESSLGGAYNIGTYSQSNHLGDVKGTYNYGAYNKSNMSGTDGYNGVLYGSYNEALMSGSDPNNTNASWSSIYGVQGKAKVTGSGDVGYMIGSNVSAEHISATADVQWLQGQHTTVKHTAGTVSGNIAVTLLDYDGGSGTVVGDFAYLQIQGDGHASTGVTGVAGESRAINSDSALPSSFNGEIFAEGFRVNTIQTAPLTSTSAGVAGTVIVASDAIYVCTATNVWVKAPLVTF